MNGYPENASSRAGHAALVSATGGRTCTYAELDQRASRLAHVLRGVGLEPGGRLATMLPNSFEFVEALAASAKLGVSALNLNWHLRAEEVAWILDDSGAGALVTDVSLRPQVAEVVHDRSLPVVWVGDDYDGAAGRRLG